jgi:hypothetical protein
MVQFEAVGPCQGPHLLLYSAQWNWEKYIYIYMCVCVCIHVHVYVCFYIDNEIYYKEVGSQNYGD